MMAKCMEAEVDVGLFCNCVFLPALGGSDLRQCGDVSLCHPTTTNENYRATIKRGLCHQIPMKKTNQENQLKGGKRIF